MAVIGLSGFLLLLGLAPQVEAGRRHAPASEPTPSPSPSPSPTPAKVTYLRIWLACDTPEQPWQIRLLPLTGPGKPADAAVSLPVDEQIHQLSKYTELPAEPASVEVTEPGHAALLLPVNFAGNSYHTLLVRQRNGTLTTDFINDTTTADQEGDLSVYDLLGGNGGNLQITIGEVASFKLNSPRASLRLRGLKRGLYQLTTAGTDPDGKPFRWTTDADFRHFRKITMLIYPDSFGRIRPRLSVDGPTNPPAETPAP